MEVNLKRKLKHKLILIEGKYLPHTLAFVYVVYTFLGFQGIDHNITGCFFHVSLIASWVPLMTISFAFEFCYVHRLPLYYIFCNEFITCIDYYTNIDIDVFNLLIIHLLFIATLIFAYTFYYIKKKHIKIFNQIILNKILNNLQNDTRRTRIIRIN